MKARIEVVNGNKTVSDKLWKNTKQFIKNSVRGLSADKIRLDIQLESPEDVFALKEWCNFVFINDPKSTIQIPCGNDRRELLKMIKARRAKDKADEIL